MAAATLADLQTFLTSFVGPILDAAMLVADQGPGGSYAPPTVHADATKRTPLEELVNRINAARASSALPAAYLGGRNVQPSTVGQNWTTLLATWVAGVGSGVYSWPSW